MTTTALLRQSHKAFPVVAVPFQGGSFVLRRALDSPTPLAYPELCDLWRPPVFTRLIRGLLEDDQYRSLQMALLLRPQQGALIPGSRGLRKIRWGTSTKGKRGGLRIIYYWDVASETLYMLFAYSKNQQGDLTRDQVRTIARLVREEFG